MAPTKAQSIYGLPKKGLVIKLASSHGLSNLEWICLNQLWYIFLSKLFLRVTADGCGYIPCQCIAFHHGGKYWQTKKNRFNVWVSTFPSHQSHIDTSIGCSHGNPQKEHSHIVITPSNLDSSAASTNARASQQGYADASGGADLRRHQFDAEVQKAKDHASLLSVANTVSTRSCWFTIHRMEISRAN